MGQGAESCGGYEVEYDPYDDIESQNFSIWYGQDGDYEVSQMEDDHISNAIRLCEKMSMTANFSCDTEKWDTWVSVFESELFNRLKSGKVIGRKKKQKSCSKGSRVGDGKKPSATVSGFKFKSNKQEMQCHCGKRYIAKVADLKRGWALSCSKRCAAIKRDFGRPNAKLVVKSPQQ